MLLLNCAVTVAAAIAIGAVLLAERRALRTYRRDSSRFRMFAARDAFVLLVVDGLMSETDPVWSKTYRATNSLLHLSTRGDVLDFISRRAQHEQAMESEPALRREFELFQRRARRRLREVPELERALLQFSAGVDCMIRERTTFLAWTSVKSILHLAALFRGVGALAGTLSTLCRGWMTRGKRRSSAPRFDLNWAFESVVVAAKMAYP